MARVLIIDDDQMFGEMLSEMVQTLGQESLCAPTLAEGLRLASVGGFNVVFLDVCMPDGSGLDALPQVRQTSSAPEVIVITGAGDPDGAELAIVKGAWDYIEKQSSLKQILPAFGASLAIPAGKTAQKTSGGFKIGWNCGTEPADGGLL